MTDIPHHLIPAVEATRHRIMAACKASSRDEAEAIAEIALRALLDAGWTVTPPPSADIPSPKAGQVWRSPNPRVEDRTIVHIGPHRTYPWAGDAVVHFTTPKRQPGQWGPPKITTEDFIAWAKKSGARPQESDPAPLASAEDAPYA